MIIHNNIKILIANKTHHAFADEICAEMSSSAQARGTGIAKRSPEYVIRKMDEGKAVIAIHQDGNWAGFCYIETWDGEYVANSGLIVSPNYRKIGLAKMIKKRTFQLSREKYPNAKIFGLTTGLAVMKINSDLGYTPVTYSELTKDEAFWDGCKSCVNYEILKSKNREICMCTGMLFDPQNHRLVIDNRKEMDEMTEKFPKFMSIKKLSLLKLFGKKDKTTVKGKQRE